MRLPIQMLASGSMPCAAKREVVFRAEARQAGVDGGRADVDGGRLRVVADVRWMLSSTSSSGARSHVEIELGEVVVVEEAPAMSGAPK